MTKRMTLTAYEETCLEEVKHWMREKTNAALDHDSDGERRAQHHLNKWCDRLDAECRRANLLHMGLDA